MNTPATIFAAWADFGPTTGCAFYHDASVSFDDAVDNYAEARDAGYPAIVWRMDTRPLSGAWIPRSTGAPE